MNPSEMVRALPLNGPNGEAWIFWGVLAGLVLILGCTGLVILWRACRRSKGVKVTIVTPSEILHEKTGGYRRMTIREGPGKSWPGSSIEGQAEPTLPGPPEKQKGIHVTTEEAVGIGPSFDTLYQ